MLTGDNHASPGNRDCRFIGSNFIRYLLNKHRDVEIVNVDNLSYGSSLSNLKGLEDDYRYGFAMGSINDGKLTIRIG